METVTPSQEQLVIATAPSASTAPSAATAPSTAATAPLDGVLAPDQESHAVVQKAKKRKAIAPRSAAWQQFDRFENEDGETKGRCKFCSLTPRVVQSLICSQDWFRSSKEDIKVEENIADLDKWEIGNTFLHCLFVVYN